MTFCNLMYFAQTARRKSLQVVVRRRAWQADHVAGFNADGTMYEITKTAPQPAPARMLPEDMAADDWMLG